MNFDIDSKIFTEVVKLASVAKTSKPVIPAIFLHVDDKKLYLYGIDPTGAIQSAVTVKKDVFTPYETTQNPVAIETTRFLKILRSLKGTVNVRVVEDKIHLVGNGVKYSESLPGGIEEPQVDVNFKDEIIPLPSVGDDGNPFDVVLKISELPNTPISSDTIELRVDDKKSSLRINDEVSDIEIDLSNDIKWFKEENNIGLLFSYDTLSTVMSIVKSNVAIYLNESLAYCLSSKEWGYVGYIIPVWGSV